MSAQTTTPAPRQTGRTGERVELARYIVSAGARILYGQRVDGSVRITDLPDGPGARAVIVERELEQDGNAALQALLADYLAQAERLDDIPMLASPIS
jgi:hypothetical protein